MLIQYVRDDMRNPIGVVIADGIRMGWSRCSHKDKFSKQRAMLIAQGRLHKKPIFADCVWSEDDLPPKVHNDVVPYLIRMAERATKYVNKNKVVNV